LLKDSANVRLRFEVLPQSYEKPCPHGLDKTLQDFDVYPQECLFIGDSLSKDGMVAASRGIRYIWAHYGHQVPAEYEEIVHYSLKARREDRQQTASEPSDYGGGSALRRVAQSPLRSAMPTELSYITLLYKTMMASLIWNSSPFQAFPPQRRELIEQCLHSLEVLDCFNNLALTAFTDVNLIKAAVGFAQNQIKRRMTVSIKAAASGFPAGILSFVESPTKDGAALDDLHQFRFDT